MNGQTSLEKATIIMVQKTCPEIRLTQLTESRVKARLQPFTVLFSFSAILVCFIDTQIHSCFREKMSEFRISF